MLQRTPDLDGRRARPRTASPTPCASVLPDKLAYKLIRLQEHAAARLLLQARAQRSRSKVGRASCTGAAQEGARRATMPLDDFRRPTIRGTSGCAWCPTATCSQRVARRQGLDRDRRRSPASTRDGVRLADGALLPADVVVTATGLQAGDRRQDRGQPGRRAGRLDAALVLPRLHVLQRAEPLGGVRLPQRQLDAARGQSLPNTSAACSTTWRDKRRRRRRPRLPEDHGMVEDDIFAFSSGYLQRARATSCPRAPRPCRGGSTRITSRTAATSASARSTTACCAFAATPPAEWPTAA